MSCGSKSDNTRPCGAQGQTCCDTSQCEADAGLACDKSNVCALALPGAQGQTCVTNGDCQSNVCAAIGGNSVCANTCISAADCDTKGWTCVGQGHCGCSPSPEVCNGIDDDCDGIVDNNAASSDCNSQMVGSSCSDGSCRCPGSQNTCGNVCTDQASDPANCGSCGHACAANEICTNYGCEKPSCKGALKCNGESCCTTLPVPGGTFPMGRSLNGTDAYPKSLFSDELPEHNVTVSAYNLEKYQVTVGRMRNFLEAYDGWRASGHPVVGEGAHPKLAGTGWQSSWVLPQDSTALLAAFNCPLPGYIPPWTDSPSGHENYPMDCLQWNVAFAFCLWDGGRLPTEAEWEFAAAGGDENRLFPWGGTLAEYGADTACPAESVCSYSSVGTQPNDIGRYGHLDLSSSVGNFVFDGYAADWYSTGGANCVDCANLDAGKGRICRNGGSQVETQRSVVRGGEGFAQDDAVAGGGLRCARD